MNTSTLAADVQEVQNISNTILATIETLDPAVASEAELAGQLETLVGGLVTAALTALQNAQGAVIDAETITALLPNPEPLPLPPAP